MISGANFAGMGADPRSMTEDVGHFFLAMKPNLFISRRTAYRARMDTLIERVRGVPRAEGLTRF